MIEEKIKIVTFRDSKESFLSLLDENNIHFIEQVSHPGVVMAAGVIVEILKVAIPSLAVVVVQWLKARSSRKVMLQTKDRQIFHLEGYSVQEVAALLKPAESLTVIDTNPNKAN